MKSSLSEGGARKSAEMRRSLTGNAMEEESKDLMQFEPTVDKVNLEIFCVNSQKGGTPKVGTKHPKEFNH